MWLCVQNTKYLWRPVKLLQMIYPASWPAYLYGLRNPPRYSMKLCPAGNPFNGLRAKFANKQKKPCGCETASARHTLHHIPAAIALAVLTFLLIS